MSAPIFPTGTVTFVFTDIEGSTKMLNTLRTDRFHEVLEVHTAALRRAFAASGVENRIGRGLRRDRRRSRATTECLRRS